MKTKKSTALLFVLPFIVFFLLFWLLPFGYGLFMSLSKYSLVKGNEGLVGLDNYVKILFSTSMYNKAFMLGLKNTVIFVLLTTPFLVLGSLGLALLLDRLPDSIKGIFRTIYFASYAVSVTAVAAVFVWLMKGNGGYLNNMLMNLGLLVKWLQSREDFRGCCCRCYIPCGEHRCWWREDCKAYSQCPLQCRQHR